MTTTCALVAPLRDGMSCRRETWFWHRTNDYTVHVAPRCALIDREWHGPPLHYTISRATEDEKSGDSLFGVFGSFFWALRPPIIISFGTLLYGDRCIFRGVPLVLSGCSFEGGGTNNPTGRGARARAPLCIVDTHHPHQTKQRRSSIRYHSATFSLSLHTSLQEVMVFSRRSWSTLAAAALTGSTTSVSANFEAGTITSVTPDASVYDTRSTLPYGCPPAGCVAANTRVSAER